MTQRRTMAEMLRELRAEIGMATDVSLQANILDAHRSLLQRAQRMLYDNEMWPHLEGFFSVEVPKNANEIALPEGINAGAIRAVRVRDATSGSRAMPVRYGWTDQELMSADPDEPGWPIQYWRIEANADLDEDDFQRRVTFWPQPDRAAVLIFEARRAITRFVDDSDKATLDSDLIVLQTAAELLNEQGSPNGPVKAAAAQQRKRDLLARERGDVAHPTSMLPGLSPRDR